MIDVVLWIALAYVALSLGIVAGSLLWWAVWWWGRHLAIRRVIRETRHRSLVQHWYLHDWRDRRAYYRMLEATGWSHSDALRHHPDVEGLADR